MSLDLRSDTTRMPSCLVVPIQLAICIALVLYCHAARADEFRVLDAYTRYADSPAINNPSDYIGWLKRQPQFQGGKLDNLPTEPSSCTVSTSAEC
jgi:hypothetical protein